MCWWLQKFSQSRGLGWSSIMYNDTFPKKAICVSRSLVCLASVERYQSLEEISDGIYLIASPYIVRSKAWTRRRKCYHVERNEWSEKQTKDSVKPINSTGRAKALIHKNSVACLMPPSANFSERFEACEWSRPSRLTGWIQFLGQGVCLSWLWKGFVESI